MTPWKWWDIYSNTPFYSSLVAISLNSAGMELSLLDLHLQYQPKQSPLANLRWSGLRRSLQQFLILNCHSFMTFQPSTSPSSHPRHHQRSSSSSSSSSPLSLAVQPACGLGSTKRELLWTEVSSALTISLPGLLFSVQCLCDMLDCASSNKLSRDTNVDTLVTQFPSFRPIELHVAVQKDSPVIREVDNLGDYIIRCTPFNYVLSFVSFKITRL